MDRCEAPVLLRRLGLIHALNTATCLRMAALSYITDHYGGIANARESFIGVVDFL